MILFPVSGAFLPGELGVGEEMRVGEGKEGTVLPEFNMTGM